jgi:hypothetical protein
METSKLLWTIREEVILRQHPLPPIQHWVGTFVGITGLSFSKLLCSFSELDGVLSKAMCNS